MPERPAGIALPAGDRTLEILVVPARIGLHHVVRVLGRDDLHDRNIVPAELQRHSRAAVTAEARRADQNSTVMFPPPVDIITSFLKHPEVLEDIASFLNDHR
jgi:hypothetical protein